MGLFRKKQHAQIGSRRAREVREEISPVEYAMKIKQDAKDIAVRELKRRDRTATPA